MESQPLPAGTIAPEFRLPSAPDKMLSLGELRGHAVVLTFYPADWSPVCGDQLSIYNEIHDEFEAHDARLLGISVDGPWSHRAFARERKLRFPLLSDFDPKGAVSRRYRAYREADGTCERTIFVIDPAGRIAWSYVSPIHVNPGAEGILAALERLREGRP